MQGSGDMINYWRMNLKWRNTGLKKWTWTPSQWLLLHTDKDISEHGSKCLSGLHKGWSLKQSDRTICALCQSRASSSMEVCVSVISDLRRSSWIMGQHRHRTSFTPTLWRLDPQGEEGGESTTSRVSLGESILILLWSFADLLVGFSL